MTNAGVYCVAVSDANGTVLSNPALLTVDLTFTKITTGRIVTNSPGSGFFCCATWVDYDGDGWEDVFVCNQGTPSAFHRDHPGGDRDDYWHRRRSYLGRL